MTYATLPAFLLGVPGSLGRLCAVAPPRRRSLMDAWWSVFTFMAAAAGLVLAIEWLRSMIGAL